MKEKQTTTSQKEWETDLGENNECRYKQGEFEVPINTSKQRFSVGSYIGGPAASMNNPVNEIITVNQQHIYIWSFRTE